MEGRVGGQRHAAQFSIAFDSNNGYSCVVMVVLRLFCLFCEVFVIRNLFHLACFMISQQVKELKQSHFSNSVL